MFAGEGCAEKPLSTLWKNYTSSSKPDVNMKVAVTRSGLKATTREHGLTEYWSHRITHCAAPPAFPRVFCWVSTRAGRRRRAGRPKGGATTGTCNTTPKRGDDGDVQDDGEETTVTCSVPKPPVATTLVYGEDVQQDNNHKLYLTISGV